MIAVLEARSSCRRPRSTVSTFGPVNVAVAVHDASTLRCLARPAEAAGELARRPTSFQRAQRRRGRSAARRTRCRARPAPRPRRRPRATCSSALDGMQPTFRQTPPSALVALDERSSAARGRRRGRRRCSRRGRRRAPRPASSVDVGLVDADARRRRLGAGTSGRGCRRPARAAAVARPLEHQDQRPLRHRVARPRPRSSRDLAGRRARGCPSSPCRTPA